MASLGAGLPYPVQYEISQAQSPSQLAQQSPALGSASMNQGGSGSSVSNSDFADAPQIVPLGVTPEMMRPRRRKQAHNPNSQGVMWGNIPGTAQGSACNPRNTSGALSFLDQLKANLESNPWGALWILLGLGVIVVAVADSSTPSRRNPGKRKKAKAKAKAKARK